MIRLTLAQMRLSLGRLVPAGLAIVLATAFVAFTLVAGNVMTASTYDQITARFGAADLVVTDPEGFTPATLAKVRGTAGVAAADPMMVRWLQLGTDPQAISQVVVATPSDPRLGTLEVIEGVSPEGRDEIALPAQAAQRLGVEVGGAVAVTTYDDEGTPVTEQVTLVGLVADPHAAWARWGDVGMADPAALRRWTDGEESRYDSILVATADPAATQSALAAAAGDSAAVRTRHEIAAERMAEETNGSNMLVIVVLGFTAIALLVAALVIANTFQVLVAQRTRTLALLRCVGARRRQLRAAVVLEGLVLGVTASVAGLLLGVGVSQAGLSVLSTVELGIPLPSVVPLSVWAVVLPLVVGTVVTVGASLVPARTAGAVSPIAALRPAEAPSVRQAAGRIRLALAGLLTVGGAALLAIATASATRADGFQLGALWVAVGVFGAGLSFLGILVGSVFWMPPLVARVGTLGVRLGLGPAAQLAAANAGRNPRRTAATSAALLIGVTLVVTMSTGAATARRSLDTMLDQGFPVDLFATSAEYSEDGGPATVDGNLAETVGAVPGVAGAVPIRATTAQLGDSGSVTVWGVTPEQARAVIRDPRVAEALAAGQAVVFEDRVTDGAVTLTAGTSHVRVAATEAWTQPTDVLVGPETLEQLDPDAAVGAVWARIDAGADAQAVVDEVQSAIGSAPVLVQSGAAERARYQRVIDIMLAVVLALLAVAVMIAVIGVANTLALSVLERRRESATLRSLGMTRRQLRASLAAEGVLVAVVGTAAGLVLGLLYGWAGSLIVFGPLEGTRLAVPWVDLGAVVAVAVAAGMLASVLPARSAVRTPPVAALAVE